MSDTNELNGFITKFAGLTEEYTFYNGECILRFDVKKHIYYLVQDTNFLPLDGVSSIVHIIDKSNALVPWGVKMMAEKLLRTIPVEGTGMLTPMTITEFQNIVIDAKSAHKDEVDAAALVGTAAHSWIEQHIKGIDMQQPPDDRSWNCCLAALEWERNHNVRWIHTEQKIYSRIYGYAGTMDGLAMVDSCSDPLCCRREFKDVLSLIDWKTSNYLYIEFFYQTALYQHAYVEEHGVNIQHRWINRLGKYDAEFESIHLTEEDYAQDLQGALDCLKLYRSIKQSEEKLKARLSERKAEIKAREQAAKAEMKKIDCGHSKQYKGVRYPRCNDGHPCQTCLEIYRLRHLKSPE